MAELAIGVVGLAALFDTCVASFSYIQLGRNFSKDYQASNLELCLVQLKLSRWGKAVGIDDSAFVQQDLLVRPVLASILNTITEAEKISEKYTSQQDVGIQKGDAMEDIRAKIAQVVISRQKKTSFGKKISWALYRKDKFDDLVQTTSRLVDQLVGLFPAVKASQAELCNEDLNKITQPSNTVQLQFIKDASQKIDQPMHEAAGEALDELAGHTFRGNDAKGALAHYGDYAMQGRGARHLYEKNTASNGAVVHYGNRSGKTKDIFDN